MSASAQNLDPGLADVAQLSLAELRSLDDARLHAMVSPLLHRCSDDGNRRWDEGGRAEQIFDSRYLLPQASCQEALEAPQQMFGSS
jgi:hypothetical protein